MPAGARLTGLDGTPQLGSLVHASATAEVWRAVDAFGRIRALKIAKRSCDVPLIRAEFELLATLDHPGIVSVHDRVADAGRYGFTLDYLGGGDLVSLAGTAPSFWLPALADLVAALGYLHARGIAHRDVKARNVMFDARDRVRLIDFGSALPFGTVRPRGGTTAPHGLRGPGVCSAADDVHALAVLTHELLTGRLPPESGGPPERVAGDGAAAELGRTADELLTAAPARLETGLQALADGIKLALPSETRTT
jgi:serine/threonine-protein kinase PpkA